MNFKTPDITPAQIAAVLGAIIAVAVAAGLPISQDLQDAIINAVIVIAPVLLGADAVIRHGRAKAAAAQIAAQSSDPIPPLPAPDEVAP